MEAFSAYKVFISEIPLGSEKKFKPPQLVKVADYSNSKIIEQK